MTVVIRKDKHLPKEQRKRLVKSAEISAALLRYSKGMKHTRKYCVYALVCPVENRIRYVGMSNNVGARYKGHCSIYCVITEREAWLQGLFNRGLIPQLVILGESDSVDEASDLEVTTILLFAESLFNCSVIPYNKIKKNK